MEYFKNSLYKNPFIWTKENALSKEFCDKVIEKFDKDQRTCQGLVGGLTGNEVNLNIKRSTDLHISDLHDWVEEDKVYHITRALKTMFDKHGNRRNKNANRIKFLWQKL